MQNHGIPTQSSSKVESRKFHYSKGSGMGGEHSGRDMQHHGISTSSNEYSNMDSEVTVVKSNRFRLTDENNSNNMRIYGKGASDQDIQNYDIQTFTHTEGDPSIIRSRRVSSN
jgi:hypothetical protein